MKTSAHVRWLVGLLVMAAAAGCGKQEEESKEQMYVAVPQVMLRDRVAAVYNKVGTAKNGEKLTVLDRQKRFVKVRTPRNEEGWVEQRYLADVNVYAQAQALSNQQRVAPSQGKATARNDANLHVKPGRDTEHVFLLAEGKKADVLTRATAERPGTRVVPKDPNDKVPPPVMEDWRLVRDADGHAGWVLARMLDLDVPLEVAQYAEGKRIVAYFQLNEVQDGSEKKGQYLLALGEPKDGQPVDYDQIRLFTWNTKRDRYETAHRERRLQGELPIRAGTEEFSGEGKLPVFVLRVRDDEGKASERKYKLNGVMVRRVLGPGEEPQARSQKGGRRGR
jgi:SH3-like domain-containing protein